MPISKKQEASSIGVRPAVPLQWTSPVRYVKGVGPEKEKLLARLEIEILGDLFYFFPRRYEKRFPVKKVSELACVDKECAAGTITKSRFVRMRGGRGVFRAEIADEGAEARHLPLQIIYYNQPFLADVFTEGSRVFLYGKAEKDGATLRMIHPEYEIFKKNAQETPVHSGRWTPVYPLTEDLPQKSVRLMLHRVVSGHISSVRDLLPEALRSRHALITLEEAFRGIHFPNSVDELRRAYRRLVFEEFLIMQLAVEIKRAEMRKETRFTHDEGADAELERWTASLDFELTGAQRGALAEILRDMKSGRAMHRLLQGDVGSGKTVVAAGALLFAAKSGFQSAVMAPTEPLAQQLFFQIQRFLEPFGVGCVYVAQGADPLEKKEALARLASGDAKVAVGTHALLAAQVRFSRLGLAVVDEQHKFGVFQRAALREKGAILSSATKPSADASCSPSANSAHFLLMTATPIPRTLSMTLYGDLDISVMNERPKGRSEVRTLWLEESRRASVYRWLDGFMSDGAQAYVICPMVDDAGMTAAKSATDEFQRLSKIFPERRLGLLHGRMRAAEKKGVMRQFKEKKIDLLVSTVVVEVGVDVPDARCMIIENAERFGLAQLHQLRGRVGRGEGESYCLLFSESREEEASERLSAFEGMASGFDIARKDLEQRGAGEYLGQKQHGLARLRIGNLEKDMALFLEARREAETVIMNDARLEHPDNKGLLRLVRTRYGGVEKIRGAVQG